MGKTIVKEAADAAVKRKPTAYEIAQRQLRSMKKPLEPIIKETYIKRLVKDQMGRQYRYARDAITPFRDYLEDYFGRSFAAASASLSFAGKAGLSHAALEHSDGIRDLFEKRQSIPSLKWIDTVEARRVKAAAARLQKKQQPQQEPVA